jgi:uncharacterized membrane protein HdeD (DUF308 family)
MGSMAQMPASQIDVDAGGEHAIGAPPRWALVVLGLVNLAVGILLLAYPGPSLEVLAIIAGVYILLFAAIGLGLAIAGSADGGRRTLEVVVALLGLIAGLLVIRHPGNSLLLLALAVGIYLVLSGAVHVALAFESAQRRGWELIVGLLELLAGIVIVAWPKFGVGTLAIVLGITLILRGLAWLAAALVLGSAEG